MTAAVQATWVSLSSGPNAQAAIATWWAQARSAILTPTLLSVARATLLQEVPVNPPAPSLPPSPSAVGSWRICPQVVSVRWAVPFSPPPVTAKPEVVYAETVRDTLTLPPITIGAAPPASAGITQFPSEFRVADYDGEPITTTQSDGRFSVQLVSTPVAYLWTFGDGTPATPGAAGSNGAVTHVFGQTSSRSPDAVGGKYSVTLTIVFDTQFQATGPGTTPGWQDFSNYGLAPLVDSATLPYEVDQLYGVLIPSTPAQ